MAPLATGVKADTARTGDIKRKAPHGESGRKTVDQSPQKKGRRPPGKAPMGGRFCFTLQVYTRVMKGDDGKDTVFVWRNKAWEPRSDLDPAEYLQ